MAKQQLNSMSKSLYLLTLLGGVSWIAYRLARRREIAETDYAARVERVLKSTPLIDGHNDLPYLLRIELQNQINDGKLTFGKGRR